MVTLTPFDTEEEVLIYANSTQYGLASILWTENLTRAHRMANRLHSGIVWINCWLLRDLRTPFGGVKNSGVGREGGFEALRFFTEPKNVCIRLANWNQIILPKPTNTEPKSNQSRTKADQYQANNTQNCYNRLN